MVDSVSLAVLFGGLSAAIGVLCYTYTNGLFYSNRKKTFLGLLGALVIPPILTATFAFLMSTSLYFVTFVAISLTGLAGWYFQKTSAS